MQKLQISFPREEERRPKGAQTNALFLLHGQGFQQVGAAFFQRLFFSLLCLYILKSKIRHYVETFRYRCSHTHTRAMPIHPDLLQAIRAAVRFLHFSLHHAAHLFGGGPRPVTPSSVLSALLKGQMRI